MHALAYQPGDVSYQDGYEAQLDRGCSRAASVLSTPSSGLAAYLSV